MFCSQNFEIAAEYGLLKQALSPRQELIETDDGKHLTVQAVFAKKEGSFLPLNQHADFPKIHDVRIVLLGTFSMKPCAVPLHVKEAIIDFLHQYHVRQDLSFDCYSFANLTRKVPAHKVSHLLAYWVIKPRCWYKRLKPGSVVFLLGEENHFYHAAVFIGKGLYISVYGAGGDLEVSTLPDMLRDYGANRVVVATPRTY